MVEVVGVVGVVEGPRSGRLWCRVWSGMECTHGSDKDKVLKTESAASRRRAAQRLALRHPGACGASSPCDCKGAGGAAYTCVSSCRPWRYQIVDISIRFTVLQIPFPNLHPPGLL